MYSSVTLQCLPPLAHEGCRPTALIVNGTNSLCVGTNNGLSLRTDTRSQVFNAQFCAAPPWFGLRRESQSPAPANEHVWSLRGRQCSNSEIGEEAWSSRVECIIFVENWCCLTSYHTLHERLTFPYYKGA